MTGKESFEGGWLDDAPRMGIIDPIGDVSPEVAQAELDEVFSTNPELFARIIEEQG